MFLTIIVRVKKINIPHQDKVIRLPPTIGIYYCGETIYYNNTPMKFRRDTKSMSFNINNMT